MTLITLQMRRNNYKIITYRLSLLNLIFLQSSLQEICCFLECHPTCQFRILFLRGSSTENRSYHWQKATRLQSNLEAYLDLWCAIVGICIKLQCINTEKIPVESVTDNYGRTVVRVKCGDKT